MSRKKHRRKKRFTNPSVNKNLPGYDILINTFGEVQSNYDIDSVNKLLNENLEDKKLKNVLKRKEKKDEEKKQ